MTAACRVTPAGGASGDGAAGMAALGIAGWLGLAAAPIFALMALLTGALGGGGMGVMCATGNGSPLAGMAPMYVLMSAFHLPPWLRLMSSVVTRRTTTL